MLFSKRSTVDLVLRNMCWQQLDSELFIYLQNIQSRCRDSINFQPHQGSLPLNWTDHQDMWEDTFPHPFSCQPFCWICQKGLEVVQIRMVGIKYLALWAWILSSHVLREWLDYRVSFDSVSRCWLFLRKWKTPPSQVWRHQLHSHQQPWAAPLDCGVAHARDPEVGRTFSGWTSTS